MLFPSVESDDIVNDPRSQLFKIIDVFRHLIEDLRRDISETTIQFFFDPFGNAPPNSFDSLLSPYTTYITAAGPMIA